MGLTCLIKLVRFLYLILSVLYHFNCIGVSFYFLVHCTYFPFSKWRPSTILDIFKILLFLTQNQITGYFYVGFKI